jgi:predicted Zn-dependent peptidase
MMFKGTPTVGTCDPARDLAIIAEMEELRERMATEEAKARAAFRRGEIPDPDAPGAMTAAWRELAGKFDRLAAEQRVLMVPNELDRIFTAAGAEGLNAFTSWDMTAYFTTMPANKLELWFWMESERLLRPVFRDFYAEREVVREERRLTVDSPPLGRLQEQFLAMFWDAQPYQWPVLGWPSDVATLTQRQMAEFFATHYAPNNVTAVLVGDFDAAEVKRLADRYFSRIPHGTRPPLEVVTREVGQSAEKRMTAEADTNDRVDIFWHTVPFRHRDSYALNILQGLLNERSGRLYQTLVRDAKLATEATAFHETMRRAGFFGISAECADGRTPQELEDAIHQLIAALAHEPVPDEELQKVKNQFAANDYRRLTSNPDILFQIINAAGLGDWREVNEAGPQHQAVTAADIRRVVATYFTKNNRAVAIFTRKSPEHDTQADDN